MKYRFQHFAGEGRESTCFWKESPRKHRWVFFHNFQGEEGELALQKSVPKPATVQVFKGIFFGGGVRLDGWVGEQPRFQQPVPKPVLQHVFLGTFCF